MRFVALTRWVFVLLFGVMLSFSSIAAEKGASYRLGPNDKVRVTVFGEPDLSGEFEISGTGVLALPLVGQVPVGGTTISEAEERLGSRLQEGFLRNPKVSIEIMNYRPFYILGEVNNPGSYPYVNGMSVLNAVALGGGFTYRADKSDIKLRRDAADGKKTELKAQPDTMVQPGDVIEVGERFF